MHQSAGDEQLRYRIYTLAFRTGVGFFFFHFGIKKATGGPQTTPLSSDISSLSLLDVVYTGSFTVAHFQRMGLLT